MDFPFFCWQIYENTRAFRMHTGCQHRPSNLGKFRETDAHFQSDGMEFHPAFRCMVFGVHLFGSQILVQNCLLQIFAQIWVHKFFRLIFWHFGFSKVSVPDSRRNKHKISREIRGVPMALPGWVSHLFFLEQTARHTTIARPKHSRRASERPPPKACLHLLQDYSSLNRMKNS